METAQDRGKKVKEDDVSSPKIPDEILTKWFLKQPIKSLREQRLVCKDWGRVISEPRFTKVHFESATPAVFIDYHSSEYKSNKCYHIMDDFADSFIAGASLPQTFMQPKLSDGYNRLDLHLANSCRGIIALHRSYGEPIHLYQPLTGEYILTPPGLRDIDITKSLSVVGLGYDPDRKLFKLVHFVSPDVCGDDHLSVVEVLTVGENEWRIVHSNNLVSCKQPVYLNDKLYFVGSVRDPQIPCLGLFAFRLATENFEEVQLHQDMMQSNISTFGILRDCLYVSIIMGFTLRVWTLNNSDNIWTQKFSILHPNPTYPTYLFLIDGHLILSKKSCDMIWVYDEGTQQLNQYGLTGAHLFSYYMVYHIPSLVSLRHTAGINAADVLRCARGKGVDLKLVSQGLYHPY